MNSTTVRQKNSALAERRPFFLSGLTARSVGAGKAEAGDVDEVAAGQRAVVVDIADAARRRSLAGRAAAMRAIAASKSRGQTEPAREVDAGSAGQQAEMRPRPLSWTRLQQPVGDFARRAFAPAAMTSSKPTAAKSTRQPLGPRRRRSFHASRSRRSTRGAAPVRLISGPLPTSAARLRQPD